MTTNPINIDIKKAEKIVLPPIDRKPTAVERINPIPFKSLAEINSMEFPPIEFLVEGLIPEKGMGIIAGNPKAGKSFLALQLGVCISQGLPFLGRETKQGSVLYLALEDNRQRIDWRSKATQELLNANHCEKLGIHSQDDEWLATNNNGGLSSIEHWIDTTPDAKLVIIDTLQVFQGIRKGQGDSYQLDTEALLPLQRLTMKKGISLICIHHMNKAGAVMGSQGILGTADYHIKLWKEEDEPTGTLVGKGRDFQEFAETLDKEKVSPEDDRGFIWKSLGQKHIYEATQESQEVFTKAQLIEMEKQTKDEPIAWTLDELFEDMKSFVKRETLAKRLQRMVKRNELIRENKKYYWINILHFNLTYERKEELVRVPYGR